MRRVVMSLSPPRSRLGYARTTSRCRYVLTYVRLLASATHHGRSPRYCPGRKVTTMGLKTTLGLIAMRGADPSSFQRRTRATPVRSLITRQKCGKLASRWSDIDTWPGRLSCRFVTIGTARSQSATPW